MWLSAACAATLLVSCSDEPPPSRPLPSDAVKDAVSRPAVAKSPLDQAVEDAIKAELKAVVARAAANDPHWGTYPTLTDDSRRSEMKDEVAADEVHVYLRGLGVHVPLANLQDVRVGIHPDRLELRLVYPALTVEIRDASESKEAGAIPEAWRAAPTAIGDEGWNAIERAVVSRLGDAGPSPTAIKERVGQFRAGSRRWEPAFVEEFDTRMKTMKGALWASNELIEKLDLGKAYMAARLMMSKQAVVASIPGSPEIPIAPVLGGPIFGLQRGRARVDHEIHGAMSGADDVWLELRMVSAAGPIAESEAFVNGFFDTMRPFEQRVNDAAAVTQAMKAARKGTDPVSKHKAALLALAALSLDPRPKRAELLVETWKSMEPAPSEADLGALIDQLATWMNGGAELKRKLQDAISKTR
jgi:hypothetical protein